MPCQVFFFDPWENDFLDKNQEEQFFLRLCWDFCVIFKHFLAGFPCKERRQDITNSSSAIYFVNIYLNVRFYDYFFSGNGSCFGQRLEGGGKHQTTVFKRLILKFNYLEEISTDTGKKSSKEEMEC